MTIDKRTLANALLSKELCESPDRRELLDKLGKLAVYTPPVMLGLMMSSRASAESVVECGPTPLPKCDP